MLALSVSEIHSCLCMAFTLLSSLCEVTTTEPHADKCQMLGCR